MIARLSFQPFSSFDNQELDKTLSSDGLALIIQMVQARIAELSMDLADRITKEPVPHIRTGGLSQSEQCVMGEMCAWKMFLESVQEIRSGTMPRQTVKAEIDYEPRKSSQPGATGPSNTARPTGNPGGPSA